MGISHRAFLSSLVVDGVLPNRHKRRAAWRRPDRGAEARPPSVERDGDVAVDRSSEGDFWGEQGGVLAVQDVRYARRRCGDKISSRCNCRTGLAASGAGPNKNPAEAGFFDLRSWR